MTQGRRGDGGAKEKEEEGERRTQRGVGRREKGYRRPGGGGLP